MIVPIPQFPDESKLLFGEDRQYHLTKSKSFEKPSFFKSPLFDHLPLDREVNRDKYYRTLAAYRYTREEKFTFPTLVERTLSSDHLYEDYVRKRFYGSNNGRRETSSRADDESYQNATETDESEPDVERTTSEDQLCGICRSINIDTLSQEHGLPHATLDVLEKSAESCPLCSTFFGEFSERATEWTPDRYRIHLSLELGSRDEVLSDHHQSEDTLRKVVWIDVIDTRPWEFPEGKIGRLIQMDRASWEPAQEERSVRGVRMLCYTEYGDPAMDAAVPWLRKIGGHTGSEHALHIAKGWLQQCIAAETDMSTEEKDELHDESFESSSEASSSYSESSGAFEHVSYRYPPVQEHEGIKRAPSAFPAERPTRLLEILPTGDLKNPSRGVRLIEAGGDKHTYAALSYCWGKTSDTWLTKESTIQEYYNNIAMESLPLTIRDALHIADSLGIRYIWVDALCIIQDSVHDWELESAKMGGIYRGALLTIAASKASSSSEGCFNEHEDPSIDPFSDYHRVQSRLKSGKTSTLYFEKHVHAWGHSADAGLFGTEVYNSSLTQRAWAYQEQILSRRTLFFAKSQLYWECDHCRLSQDNSQQAHTQRAYPVLTFTRALTKAEVMSKWYRDAVESYSRRALTNPGDKLVAISAVAKATYLNRHVKYMAGLWEDCILPGLCWVRDGPGRKNTNFACPSWSWASQQSGVSYSAVEFDRGARPKPQDARTQPDVVHASVEASERNPFGDVRRGQVQLSTRVTTAYVMRDKFGSFASEFRYSEGSDHQALIIPESNSRRIWHATTVMDDDDCRVRKVTVALMSNWSEDQRKWTLLVLEKIVLDGEESFRRIGLGILKEDYVIGAGKYAKPNFERDWVQRVITIV